MTQISDNDRALIGLLQKGGAKSVSELSELMNVTETAVRQRLTRLVAQNLITRVEEKVSRGRPVHKYSVTKEGRASNGQNFLDLASVIWDEVRAIDDRQIRSQLIQGIAKRLAAKYKDEIDQTHSDVSFSSATERAEAIAHFFESRGIPVTVSQQTTDESGGTDDPGAIEKRSGEKPSDQESYPAKTAKVNSNSFPILQLHGCPYPGLSERDDLICEMEQSMFSELAGCEVELSRCDRKSESDCCSFQLEPQQLETASLKSQSHPNE